MLQAISAQKNRYIKCNFQLYFSDIYLLHIKLLPCSLSFKSPAILTFFLLPMLSVALHVFEFKLQN